MGVVAARRGTAWHGGARLGLESASETRRLVYCDFNRGLNRPPQFWHLSCRRVTFRPDRRWAQKDAILEAARCDPLHWWRRLHSDQIGGREIKILGLVLGESRSILPNFGDSAEAYSAVAGWTSVNGAVDLAMSSILSLGLNGDDQARSVLRQGLRHFSSGDPEMLAIAKSWSKTK